MKHHIVTGAILFTAAAVVSLSGMHAKAGTVYLINKTLDPHKTPLELYRIEVIHGNPWWKTTCKISP